MSSSEQELVGIQGLAGSNHEIAARQLYGDAQDLDYIMTFEELFTKLKNKKVGRAVVAFGNNSTKRPFIDASIDELMTNFDQYWLTDPTGVLVSHNLLAKPGATLDDIDTIHSMDVALDQCRKALRELFAGPDAPVPYLPRDVAYKFRNDTAESARFVAQSDSPKNFAAVAPKRAGELYGLDVLVSDIQDNKHNLTRFFEWSLRDEGLARATGDEDKTLMLVRPPDNNAGALLHLLTPLSEQEINLEDIHNNSAPAAPGTVKRIPQFLIEANAGFQSDEMKEVIRKLKAMGAAANILGSWKEPEQEAA